MSVASEITRLQNAKASLKTSINAKTDAQHKITNETLEDYSAFVDSITGGGGQTNIYRVPTIAQRNLINANEDDMCVVENNSIGNWQQNTNASSITFPQQVILSSAYMDWFDGMLRADQSSGVYFDGQISLYEQEFRLQGWGDDIQVNVQYNSNDGITYTRQRIEAEDMSTQTSLVDGDTINLPFNVYMDGNWTDEIGYFMQTGAETFDGLFIYKNNAWQYAYVGANTEAMDLFTGKLAYTNNGFVNGTLGTAINNTSLKSNYKTICDCINNYQPTDLSRLFMGSQDSQFPITRILNTTNTTNMSEMFANCSNLTSVDLAGLGGNSLTTIVGIISGCSSLVNVNMSNFNFGSASLQGFGNNLRSLQVVNLKNANTSNVPNMSSMFAYCTSITTINLDNIDTSNVINMKEMFHQCNLLTALNLSSFDTSNVTNMSNMFTNCFGLTELDLSSFNTDNVTNVASMFYGCSNLTRLDIRNCKFTQITSSTYYNNMFGTSTTRVPANCLIIVKDNAMKTWITSKFNWLTNVKTPSEL